MERDQLVELDIFAQNPKINGLYTQLTFCLPLSDDSPGSQSKIIKTLKAGLEELRSAFPWTCGEVVKNGTTYKIRTGETKSTITQKVYTEDPEHPDWTILSQTRFPFSMLDEPELAPYPTVPNLHHPLPAFPIQANFIRGGLLLTFNAQHGAMDMASQTEVIRLFAKACRGEAYTELERQEGNMSRQDRIPFLSSAEESISTPNQIERETPTHQDAISALEWTYVNFTATSLRNLKTTAMRDVPEGRFVSTDDTLSALIWQAITRLRLHLHPTWSTYTTHLSRNVNIRAHFSLPASAPGLLVHSTSTLLPLSELVQSTLGQIALLLRNALDTDEVRHATQVAATQIRTHGAATPAVGQIPELDVRLSSWAQEGCYDIDFGPGLWKAAYVRRPRFIQGAREGLVYFLPKTLDGDVVVGVCLQEGESDILRKDAEFGQYGTLIENV